MRKIVSVLLCVLVLFSAFAFYAFAVEENEQTKETTEFVLEIDVNKRYTDFVENADEIIGNAENSETKKGFNEEQKTVYIAVLVAALAVSIVVLVVSLKKVPKEEDIDISGKNKIKKADKE